MTRMRRDVEDRKEKQMILQETKTEKENEQVYNIIYIYIYIDERSIPTKDNILQ